MRSKGPSRTSSTPKNKLAVIYYEEVGGERGGRRRSSSRDGDGEIEGEEKEK
jgi:hypothetical protein